MEVLRKLTTDDYIHTNGSSPPIKKEDWLDYLQKRKAKMMAGDLAITKYELTDTLMRVIGTTVLVSGRMDIEGIENQVPFSTSLRVTNFWVLENEAWKRAAFHDTKIEVVD